MGKVAAVMTYFIGAVLWATLSYTHFKEFEGFQVPSGFEYEIDAIGTIQGIYKDGHPSDGFIDEVSLDKFTHLVNHETPVVLVYTKANGDPLYFPPKATIWARKPNNLGWNYMVVNYEYALDDARALPYSSNYWTDWEASFGQVPPRFVFGTSKSSEPIVTVLLCLFLSVVCILGFVLTLLRKKIETSKSMKTGA